MNVNIDPISNLPGTTYNEINKFGANPIILTILVVVVIVYYLIFSSLPSSRNDSVAVNNNSYSFFEIMLWAVFLALVLLNAITYFYSAELNANIDNLFGKKPNVEIEITSDKEPEPVPEIKLEKQVFHIPGNHYSYNDAKILCKAYGAKLANYEEIEQSYKDGGEWCSYGWSDNQLALFPTQKSTYNKLQSISGHENDCGRPGINGGYISNTNIKYGVNCYGYKPKITDREREDMATNRHFPRSKDELKFEKQLDYWKRKLPEIEVSPFNRNNWSKI